MFDAIFGIFTGVSQILMLLMGMLFFGIGALMVLYPVWQSLTWKRVRARIVEVRARVSPFSQEETIEPQSTPVTSFSQEFKKSPSTGLLALLVAFLVIGVPLLFVGVGSYIALDYVHLKTQGLESQGKIVRFDERESNEGGSTYVPVIEFRDHEGVIRTEAYKISSSSRMGLETGQMVRVFYKRDRPAHFIIDHFWLNMVLPIGFIGLGGLFLFVMFFRGIRKLPAGHKALKKTSAISNVYYPTYEYVTPDGRLVRAEGDSGSSSLGDKIPGSDVTVFLKKNDFEAPSQPSFLLSFFGLWFALPGIFILYLAIRQFDFSIHTLIAGIVMTGFVGYRIAKSIKPRSEWDTRESFKAKMKAKRERKRAGSVLLTSSEFNALLRQNDRVIMLWMPLYILVTVGMIVGGIYLFNSQKEFQTKALTAQGEVVRLIPQSDSEGIMYYPLVSFRTTKGQSFEFKDKVGSNPPSYSTGDNVRILYLPESPQEAIVDRGWLNQLPGAGLMLAGGLLFLLAMRSLLAAKARTARL